MGLRRVLGGVGCAEQQERTLVFKFSPIGEGEGSKTRLFSVEIPSFLLIFFPSKTGEKKCSFWANLVLVSQIDDVVLERSQ